MEQAHDLKALPVLDSMHDQRAQSIELKGETFILHYTDLHHNENSKYRSCDVTFFGIEDADIIAEVRKSNGLIVDGIRYYDVEFLDFIKKHDYIIETIYFYQGYGTVVIEAALVDKNGRYCEDCIIKVSATKIIYCWK